MQFALLPFVTVTTELDLCVSSELKDKREREQRIGVGGMIRLIPFETIRPVDARALLNTADKISCVIN